MPIRRSQPCDLKAKENGLVSNLVGNVKNRSTIIIDDMVDTGETLFHSIEKLVDAGTSKIYVIVIHGIFSGKGTYINNATSHKNEF